MLISTNCLETTASFREDVKRLNAIKKRGIT